MSDIVHVLGNGDNSHTFDHNNKVGKRIICNVPPFAVENVFATCIVDFKMMFALFNNELNLDSFPWVLGNRPKMFMNDNPSFHIQKAKNIREYYLTVPKYAGNATNFNCGHMAVHYSAVRLKAKEIHMYGFDSLFDYNMNSVSDFLLPSDRGDNANFRLLHIWRPIWVSIFNEFPDKKFVLHHRHSDAKVSLPENVEVFVKR